MLFRSAEAKGKEIHQYVSELYVRYNRTRLLLWKDEEAKKIMNRLWDVLQVISQMDADFNYVLVDPLYHNSIINAWAMLRDRYDIVNGSYYALENNSAAIKDFEHLLCKENSRIISAFEQRDQLKTIVGNDSFDELFSEYIESKR